MAVGEVERGKQGVAAHAGGGQDGNGNQGADVFVQFVGGVGGVGVVVRGLDLVALLVVAMIEVELGEGLDGAFGLLEV